VATIVNISNQHHQDTTCMPYLCTRSLYWAL